MAKKQDRTPKFHIRGPKSAWIFFCLKNRKRVLEDHPETPFGDICKKLSPMWKALSTTERQPYLEMYRRDKERHSAAMASMTKDDKKAYRLYKRNRRKKRTGMPKRAMSAYMFFVNVSRDSVKKSSPGASFTDVARILGQRWRSLDAEAKRVYQEKNAADKARYDAEMSVFMANRAKARAAAAEARAAKKALRPKSKIKNL